ncbi:MAG TPA: GAF domain-containing sensor histidine kinase [Streptosporangiaceae bacterium]|nr:GAF domain-containing sensor histidine kinase [Streptosporangiaceae bacterium]
MTAEPVPSRPDQPCGPGGLDELYRVSQVVLSVTRQMPVRDVLQVIVQSARSLVGARYAALGVPDAHGSFAEFVVDGISDRQWRAIGPLPRQHGMLGVLLREARPERLADIRADPRFEGGWPSAHPDLSGFLGVPVKDGGQVLAIIFAANKVTPAPDAQAQFTARDEELLSLFAAHAAIALTNARLSERSRELSVLEERARLARDLHDAVSQKLFSLRARARAAAVLAGRDPARAAAEMEAVAQLGAEAHAELRAVIDGLAPPELGEAGLAESLRRYAVLAGRAHGVAVDYAATELPALDEQQEAALYRVAQEALHNALRHAGARRVTVGLTRSPRRIILEVADDGAGFAPGAPEGLGFASMRGRAEAVGGTLAIRSAPGRGTAVRLTVPLRRPPAVARG